MGVINVTHDSFFDGGRYITDTAILQRAEKMLAEGADFIDVGGYSTRPGASDISLEEEQQRVGRAVSLILRQFPGAVISVDTFRSRVAEAAVDAGAGIINDVSGGNLDPEMIGTIARLGVPYIVMHMRGTPQTMQQQTQYTDLVNEVIRYLEEKIFALRQLGAKDVIVDPGFGFSKTITQNFDLLRNLHRFSILGRPVLVGLSRKSMIWKTLNTDPESALNGTTVLNTVALLKGADIVRVHDVAEARQVLTLLASLNANTTA